MVGYIQHRFLRVIRTFLDAGVLIAAFRSRNTVSTPALTLLDDPGRVFVTSDYVRLEVLPKPLYFRRHKDHWHWSLP